MFNLGELNSSSSNLLLDYLKNQSPETLATVAQSVTPEAQQIINQNIQNLLGILPPQHFNVSITTDRENLAGLIGSAMMTGYFIRQIETRMQLEHSLETLSLLPLKSKGGAKRRLYFLGVLNKKGSA
ncbi:MAG: DUF760 domain-containing protein [Pseudanabaena sp.]